MEKIRTDQWQNSAGIPPAGQAFVSGWLELFHRLTIDSYRVRHLNVRLGLEELAAVIQEVDRLGTEVINVENIASEVLRLLKEDPVAAGIAPQRQHYYTALAQPLVNKAIHPGLAVLVDQLRVAFVRQYRGALIDGLREAIQHNDVDRTVQITGALGSDLIGEGYDLRHLYWRGQYFTRPPVRQFFDKLNDLLERFQKAESNTYRVVSRLVFNTERDANNVPATIGNMTLTAHVEGLTHPRALDFLKQDALFRYAHTDVKATDPFAASRGGTAELARALDLLQFVRPGTAIHVQPAVLITGANDTALTVPLSPELLGPIRIASEELEVRVRQVGEIARDGRISETTRDRVAAGLRYLRRGLTDSAPHGQFLNFWIGLESIAGGVGRTLISPLRERVSRLVALGYPRRLLTDLRANIRRLELAMPGTLPQEVYEQANRTAALTALWRALMIPGTRQQILESAATEPLLRHRLEMVASAMGTRPFVRQAIERATEDISWHVQRMYRVRNAIVHGGYIPGDLTHLGSHLATYLWAILRVVIEELARPDGIADIEQIFAKFSWLYERQLQLLREPGDAEPAYELLLQPTLMWPEQ